MAKVTMKFDDKYPDGHKTLQRWVDVAGLHVPERQKAVATFAAFKKQHLSMKPEPRNKHDPHAVAVFGHGITGLVFKTRKKVFLGYVPADLAQSLADNDLQSVARIHLNQIDINGEYFHVKFSISIPSRGLQR